MPTEHHRKPYSLLIIAAAASIGPICPIGPMPACAADPDHPTSLQLAAEADLRLDPAVASPKDVLGFEPGDRAIRHLEIQQYLRRLDETSDRVELREHGKTYEGRTLYHVVISDPANIKRLDAIRADIAKLADPRKTTDAQAQPIIANSPAVAWLLYTVHGDELSGTDGAILAAYRLAAARDDATAAILKSVVICIDPLQNPDGRERFLSMLQQAGGTMPTSDFQSLEHSGVWPRGRGNHYLFDMNRDWNVTVHPESRGRVEAISAWNPQLFVDGHEMGPTETFLFSPPREPLNINTPSNVWKWMRQYSSEQADAFDRLGWSYYRGEWNEGWAIGFADMWARHHCCAGILYEQARSDGALVKLPTGQDRYYRQDVAQQYLSTMANLKSLAAHRREILADFYADKKRAVADEPNPLVVEQGTKEGEGGNRRGATGEAGSPASKASGPSDTPPVKGGQGGGVAAPSTAPNPPVTSTAPSAKIQTRRDIFAFIPGTNRSRAADFLAMLQRQHIETFVIGPTKLHDVQDIYGQVQPDKDFPAGTIVVSMHQPLGPLARAMLEFDPRMSDDFLKVERRELELKGGSKMYDVTAWCIAMGYDVEAYWAKGDDQFTANLRTPATPEAILAASPPTTAAHATTQPAADTTVYGYIIDGDDDASLALVGRLLQSAWKIRVSTEPFTNSGQSFPRGSFLIRMQDNDRGNSDTPPEKGGQGGGVGSASDVTTLAVLRAQLASLPPNTWREARTARSTAGPDLGGGKFPLLEEPRIALLGDTPFATTNYGEIWHALDVRVGLRISRLEAGGFPDADLRKYNVIILPENWGGGRIARIFDRGMLDRLRQWMSDGGTLIAIGSSAAMLCRPDAAISAVRPRGDVLKQLDQYAEALWRERAAATPSVDAAQVWDFDKSKGFTTTRPAEAKPDQETLERYEAWAGRFMPHGVILRADLHPDHWLTSGMRRVGRGRLPPATEDQGSASPRPATASSPNEQAASAHPTPIPPDVVDTAASVPAMYGGGEILMSMPPVETIARLAPAESLRLGGLLWPEARQRLADAAYMTREGIGRGQLILFAADPTFRAYFRGTERLLLNAVILAPGAGGIGTDTMVGSAVRTI